MTLRLRLLLLLVGTVAVGLLVSDLVTYNVLRSFLTDRVDQQLEVAAFPVGRALLSTSGLGPSVPAAPPLRSRTGSALHRSAFPSRAFRNGGGLLGPSSDAGRDLLVPPGTYGALRDGSGRIEAHIFFTYGARPPAAPRLPTRLPGSGTPAGSDLVFATSSSGPAPVSYRALAKPLSGGAGVIVVAVPLTDLDSTLRRLLLAEIVVSGVLLTGLGLFSWFMVRRDLRPLVAMTATAGAITRGDLSQRVSPAAEGTEVGQLGTAFNTMIDEIEGAFAERSASEERLRRFLADASHELRTPLTSILGYAELFDMGLQDRPADLARSLHHIRDEAARMGTLVDDLFLLAQLDHERPLDTAPVDVVDLVLRSVEGLAVSAPHRPVSVDAGGPLVVDGDRHRLRQVVDNLLANAVAHTPEGAAIEVRVTPEGGWALLRVHDHGPGIDPADAARIFEPFFRSDPSRDRASGGAGLGLAIVAAIVGAHGGEVTAVPGDGATFEVRIPRRRTDGDLGGVPAGADGPGG